MSDPILLLKRMTYFDVYLKGNGQIFAEIFVIIQIWNQFCFRRRNLPRQGRLVVVNDRPISCLRVVWRQRGWRWSRDFIRWHRWRNTVSKDWSLQVSQGCIVSHLFLIRCAYFDLSVYYAPFTTRLLAGRSDARLSVSLWLASTRHTYPISPTSTWAVVNTIFGDVGESGFPQRIADLRVVLTDRTLYLFGPSCLLIAVLH